MPWPKRSRKGERVIKRKRADGSVKEYRYPKYKPRPRVDGDSISALIDAYKNSPEWSALSDSTKAHRATYLKPLAELGSLPAKGLKRRDIMTIRDAIAINKKRGPGAATGFVAACSALFLWALDREWIEHTPMQKVKRPAIGHWRSWTRQEADAAERGLPPHLRRVVVLARHTGQRRGDLCAMTWAAYDGQSIRLVQQKTKPGEAPVSLVIPATATLRAELDAWKPRATAVTILTNARGRPWQLNNLSHAMRRELAAIGMPESLNVHGLRKLAATELANAGCSSRQIAAITGHRTLAMVELYTRDADQERLAQDAISRLIGKNKPR